MKILIKNNQKKERIPQKKIIQKSSQILKYLSLDKSELSILITDDKEIKKLNSHYRKKNSPTNVLSFPPEKRFKKTQKNILGDIVISIETVKRESKKDKTTISQKLSQLLIHSILHLLNYEHSIEMEKKSLEILRIIEKDKRLPFI